MAEKIINLLKYVTSNTQIKHYLIQGKSTDISNFIAELLVRDILIDRGDDDLTIVGRLHRNAIWGIGHVHVGTIQAHAAAVVENLRGHFLHLLAG